MSLIEAKGVYRLLRDWVYRRHIRQAERASARSSTTTDPGDHIILITSSDSKTATRELRFARANFNDAPYRTITCITPGTAWNELDGLPVNWTCVPYGTEQATRFALPTRGLCENIARRSARVTVLLATDPDPYVELLFAHAHSPHKVTFNNDNRLYSATLIVSPASNVDDERSLRHLFNTMDTFLPAPQRPVTA